MANRVFERLARLDHARRRSARRRKSAATGVKRVDAKRRARARKLFAEALETPGGLKVQTIHAFCTRLLQQFPFEADVAARFQVLEETQQKQMLEDIRMERAARGRRQARQRRRAARSRRSSRWRATWRSSRRCRRRSASTRRVIEWLDHAGGIDGAMAELSQALGIDAGRHDRERRRSEIVRRTDHPDRRMAGR